MLQDDPFNQVRSQVVSTLATAERQHTKWGEARRRKPVRHDECVQIIARARTRARRPCRGPARPDARGADRARGA